MSSVEISTQDHVAIVTLNRPQAANALNAEMRTSLVHAWIGLNGDPNVRSIVLTGAGETTFCAGSDLKDPQLDNFNYLADERYGSPPRSHFMANMKTFKPTVCAINGHALGGGLELALLAEIRLASENAMFGMPEVGVGSMPGAGATQRLPRLIASSDAFLMLLAGERLDARRALQAGLVSEVTTPANLLPRALEIAGRIAANAPLAVRATVDATRAAADLPLAQGLALERHLFGLVRATGDRDEGRAAFRDGRRPDFQGG